MVVGETTVIDWLRAVWPAIALSLGAIVWTAKKGRDIEHLEGRVDGVEADLEQAKKDCIKPALCGERMEACQRYIRLELGHGEKRFERLEKTVDDTRRELKEDMGTMKEEILAAIKSSN